MRYRTTILQTGGTTTGLPVPDDVLAALGQGKKPPVRVTLGEHTYRSTVAVMGGVAMIALSSENRAAAGVEGGQEVDVDVELDTEPRIVEVPPDLAEALAAVAGARERFDALSPSRQKAHVVSVTGAKAAETRARRVEKVVGELSG